MIRTIQWNRRSNRWRSKQKRSEVWRSDIADSAAQPPPVLALFGVRTKFFCLGEGRSSTVKGCRLGYTSVPRCRCCGRGSWLGRTVEFLKLLCMCVAFLIRLGMDDHIFRTFTTGAGCEREECENYRAVRKTYTDQPMRWIRSNGRRRAKLAISLAENRPIRWCR